MTMQNGLVHRRKAYLWCDTAYWDGVTGEMIGQDTKAFQGLHWPFAGVLSLWGDDPFAVPRDVGEACPSNLDSLLSTVAESLRSVARKGGGGRVLIASYTDRPRLHVIGCHGMFPGSGFGPFEPVELGHFVSSCNETDAYKAADASEFSPAAMRQVIDVQCVTPFEGHGQLALLGPRVWAGGNVVRIEVGAKGVTSAVERPVGDRLGGVVAA